MTKAALRRLNQATRSLRHGQRKIVVALASLYLSAQ